MVKFLKHLQLLGLKSYEWDFEKREPRKIEQKPAWSEEDELMRKEAISIIKQYNIICEREGDKCYTADRVIAWLEKRRLKIMTNQEKAKVISEQFHIDDVAYDAAEQMAIETLSTPLIPINIDEDKLIESELDKKWLVERDMEGNVINGVSEWKGIGSLMNFPAVFDLAKYFYHLGKQNLVYPPNLDNAAKERIIAAAYKVKPEFVCNKGGIKKVGIEERDDIYKCRIGRHHAEILHIFGSQLPTTKVVGLWSKGQNPVTD